MDPSHEFKELVKNNQKLLKGQKTNISGQTLVITSVATVFALIVIISLWCVFRKKGVEIEDDVEYYNEETGEVIAPEQIAGGKYAIQR